ncbi:MAG: c-type cytochrome biogenesis protein CcmI [Actinomycetota bacterium]|nr:c-type cytochrome biogenesis protein CcmI [Actinomycetota bacterium]
MEIVLALMIIAALAAFVAMPLRRRGEPEPSEDPARAELEARKQAKYRQIRDLEMDREQGKITQADWARADAELRREAMAILREIDRL